MTGNKKNSNKNKKHGISSNTLSNYNELMDNFLSLNGHDENVKTNAENNIELPKQKKQRLSLVFDIGEKSPFKFNEKVVGNDHFKYMSPSITPDNRKFVYKKNEITYSTIPLISPVEEVQLLKQTKLQNEKLKSPNDRDNNIKNKKNDFARKKNKNRYELQFKTEAKHNNEIYQMEEDANYLRRIVNENDNNKNICQTKAVKESVNISNKDFKNNYMIEDSNPIDVIIIDENGNTSKYNNESNNQFQNIKKSVNNNNYVDNKLMESTFKTDTTNIGIWSESEPLSADLFNNAEEDDDILLSSKLSDDDNHNDEENVKLIDNYDNNDIVMSSTDLSKKDEKVVDISDSNSKEDEKLKINTFNNPIIILNDSDNIDDYDNQLLINDSQNDENNHLNNIEDEISNYNNNNNDNNNNSNNNSNDNSSNSNNKDKLLSLDELVNKVTNNEDALLINSIKKETETDKKECLIISNKTENNNKKLDEDKNENMNGQILLSETKDNNIENKKLSRIIADKEKIKNNFENNEESNLLEKDIEIEIEDIKKTKEMLKENFISTNQIQENRINNIPSLLNSNVNDNLQQKVKENSQDIMQVDDEEINKKNIDKSVTNTTEELKVNLGDGINNNKISNEIDKCSSVVISKSSSNPSYIEISNINSSNENYQIKIERLKSILIPNKNHKSIESIINSECNCLHLNKNVKRVVVGKYSMNNSKNWLIMETSNSIEIWNYNINFDNGNNICYWTKFSERLKNFCDDIKEIQISPTNEYIIIIGNNYRNKEKNNYYRCGLIIDIYTLNEIYLDIKINDSINISNQIYNNFDIKYDDDFPKICFPLNEYNNNENNLNYEEGINKLFLPGYKNGQLVEFTIKKNLSKIENCTYPIPKNSTSPLLSILSYDNDNPSIIGLMKNNIIIWNIKTKEILSEILLSSIPINENIKLISNVIPPINYLSHIDHKNEINQNHNNNTLSKPLDLPNKYFSIIFYTSSNNKKINDECDIINNNIDHKKIDQLFGLYIFSNNQLIDKVFYETSLVHQNNLIDDEMTCYEYSENYIFIGYKSGKIFLWEKNSREIAAILSDPKNSCAENNNEVLSLSFNYMYPRKSFSNKNTPGLLFANYKNNRIIVFYVC